MAAPGAETIVADSRTHWRRVKVEDDRYRLCAFLDADSPLEIFRRLVVGSEGTLAFVAEALRDALELEGVRGRAGRDGSFVVALEELTRT